MLIAQVTVSGGAWLIGHTRPSLVPGFTYRTSNGPALRGDPGGDNPLKVHNKASEYPGGRTAYSMAF